MNSLINSIIPLIDDSVNSSLLLLKNNNEGIKSFQLWLESNQNSIDFQSNIIIKESISNEKIQFCLESVLANAMRLFLIRDKDISAKNIRYVFEEANENLSTIIFENDFYTWLINIEDDKINASIIEISDLLRSQNIGHNPKIQ